MFRPTSIVRLVLAVLLAGGALVPARADLPGDLDAFCKRHADEGRSPRGAIHLWFEACFVYMNPDTRDAGRQMLAYLTIPFRGFDDWDRETENALFAERLQKPEYQHIFRSYAEGAEPDNGYAMDGDDFELRIAVSRDDRFGRGWEIGLRSSGAENPRPVYLRRQKDTNLWFVSAYANVYIDVEPAQG